MALTFRFDAPRRLIVEPGFRQFFSSAQLALSAQPADGSSTKQFWCEDAYGTIMLKPLQLQEDFLNHAAQLANNCVLRLATDYYVEAADLAATTIFEDQVGSPSNPWMFHTPATPDVLGPSIPPVGPTPFYGLGIPAGESEVNSRTVWSTSPGAAGPAPSAIELTGASTDLRLLVSSTGTFRPNQGFLFRWFQPDPKLTSHQTIYGFVFGQYLLYCRNSLLEIFRDVSPGGDRSQWKKQYSDRIFAPGAATRNVFNPAFAYGSNSLYEPPGEDRSLLVIPFRRQHIYIQAGNTGKVIVLTVLNDPRLRADGTDWDITREGTVEVWALTGVPGRFQTQIVKYEAGPATLNFPPIITEYTPAGTPDIDPQYDQFYDEALSGTLQFPQLYTFATNPSANDCPPPTADGTGRTRSYGLTLTMAASTNRLFTPQFYGLEVHADPSFMDNPATPTTVSDTGIGADTVVLSAELSMGTTPGEGTMTAHLQDKGAYPLQPYYYRSEIPVDLRLSGTTLFQGYTDRMDVSPLRQTGAPRDLAVHSIDKWLLLEGSYLRDQRDWQGVGHITVVDNIAQQAGIDTVAQPAEYPAGWDGAFASMYNTPLGTPISTADNLEGNQLLGWKPQLNDTAATYVRRIQEFFSGWLMGFRSTGAFYYLPYNYFTAPTVVFHYQEGGVTAGLVPTGPGGLTVSVSPGSAAVAGRTVTSGIPIIIGGLTPLAVNYLYLDSAGVGTSNTTGVTPAGSIGLGTATTNALGVLSVNTGAGSGRQLSTSPIFRNPVEYRTIEPSGNVIQLLTKYQIDLTSNHSALFVDWASILNPAAPNYLGRYKWFKVEIAGAFTCPQLNAMGYIVFQNARRRRQRVTFQADYVPGFEIGHAFTLEGDTNYRLIQMRATLVKSNWEQAVYTGEAIETGTS